MNQNMGFHVWIETTCKEKSDCLEQHLRSLNVHSFGAKDFCPESFLEKIEDGAVAWMKDTLRLLKKTEHFCNLSCDIALFTQPKTHLGQKNHIQDSFLLFFPTEKTKAFLQEWASKENDNPFTSFQKMIEKKALSMQILQLPTPIKSRDLKEPIFGKWFLEI